jgi:hypothetical protein
MNLTKNQIILIVALYLMIFVVGIFIGKYTEKLYGIERVILEDRKESRGEHFNSPKDYQHMRMMKNYYQR